MCFIVKVSLETVGTQLGNTENKLFIYPVLSFHLFTSFGFFILSITNMWRWEFSIIFSFFSYTRKENTQEELTFLFYPCKGLILGWTSLIFCIYFLIYFCRQKTFKKAIFLRRHFCFLNHFLWEFIEWEGGLVSTKSACFFFNWTIMVLGTISYLEGGRAIIFDLKSVANLSVTNFRLWAK